MTATPNNQIDYVPENAFDPAAGLNISLLQIDALLQCVIISFLGTPPGSPNEGDRYIVSSGTGAWSGHDDELAVWEGAAWSFYMPAIVLNKDDSTIYINVGDSNGWQAY